MSKKRRVWWIVSSGVILFLVFSVAATILESNRPERRVDPILREIFNRHSFEPVEIELNLGPIRKDATIAIYSAPMLTKDELIEIYDDIDSEFGESLWVSSAFGYADDSWGCILKFGDQNFTTKEIAVYQNPEYSLNASESTSLSVIIVAEYRPPSLMARLKNLWPR